MDIRTATNLRRDIAKAIRDTPDTLDAADKIMALMEQAKHLGTHENRGLNSDGWVCSCGWESDSYHDNAARAKADWQEHVNTTA